MIKVIIEYKVRKDEDIQPIILKLRSHAMQYPGFIGAENLISEEDSSIIVVEYTWRAGEHWRLWEESSIRQAILHEIAEFLEVEPRVGIYRIAPTVGWT